VSRGELVEIGGGFRVPDVLAQSGAVLREVGTTNRTRLSDYAAAIQGHTAMMLRVHPSNFHIEGFTERPAIAELAALARQFSIPLVEDLSLETLALKQNGSLFEETFGLPVLLRMARV
jgi:L-seryl-tRNA(Ser) seleniumtransferase